MNLIKKILAILVLIVVLVAAFLFIQGQKPVFDGASVKTEDNYLLQFTKMHQKDSHTMSLEEGDSFTVDIHLTQGKTSITIGLAGESPIYTSDGLSNGGFEVAVPKSGDYEITLNVKHASGVILIEAQR